MSLMQSNERMKNVHAEKFACPQNGTVGRLFRILFA